MSSKIIKLTELIKYTFPKLNWSFAYGSAIMPQTSIKGKMIDLIFVVDNLEEFHKQNLKSNPGHYSPLARLLGYKIISRINQLGNQSYYNPNIKIPNIEGIDSLKYGIIAKNSAEYQLVNWSNLFLVGRLHKPVMMLNQPDDQVQRIINENLETAV